ncbi:MAG: glycosyltransferase family 1 protein [Chitinophagaceae bacterium]
MKIAINARFLLKGKLEGIGWFTNEIVRRMVSNHPEHTFYFFFDRPYSDQFIFAKNVIPVVLNPPARHPVLWYIWFEWSVRKALKKYKIDVFLSTDGFCTLHTSTPTLLVIHDLAFVHFPEHLPFKFKYYLNKFTPKFVKKATHIVTVSSYTKQDLIKTYHTPENKIDIVYNGAHHLYKPLMYEERNSIKEKYAHGCEYFVFAGAMHPRKNIVTLLKAFAKFKHKNFTNMKLLLIGRFAWHSEDIKLAIETHPFKEDVVHLSYMNVEELSNVIGAAYALTFVSLFEGFGIPILEAMKCEVPAILSTSSSLPEVGGNACLYANATNSQEIADKMTLLYKDEALRAKLIQEGKTQMQKFDWEISATRCYDALMKCCKT